MGFVKTQSDHLKLDKGVELLQQTYEKSALPSGVFIIKQAVFTDDTGGWFKENLRVDENGFVVSLKELGVDFKIVQSNNSTLGANGKRFWHIHPAKESRPGQNEIWSLNGTILMGLVDLRKDSPTVGLKVKVVLSPEKAIYIPAGIAHGFINPNSFPVSWVYFTDKTFTADETTQEHRIDPKQLPYDFVETEIM